MADKFNLDGFSVDTNNKCTAEGGFQGDLSGDSVEVGSVIADSITATTSDLTVLQAADTLLESTVIKMENIPTSDPSVAGQLWNNAGVLTISTGA